MDVLGIDIGGSGIKGAVVDCTTGQLKTERHRVATPSEATPRSMGEAIASVVEHFSWKGPVGAGFPGVIRHGIVHTSANVDDSWQGVHFPDLLRSMCGCNVYVTNDADAAGLAEMQFGAGAKEMGTVIMITIGTGLGTALFLHGRLWENSELGHLPWKNGVDAENFASDRVRKQEDLSRKAWAKRFNDYLVKLHELLWPDLFILGGGASKKFDKFREYFDDRLRVVPAALQNHAGIVGAAVFGMQQEELVGME